MHRVAIRPVMQVIGIALVGSLTGCAGLNDPFHRAGTWSPEGLNDRNIAAMLARPSDAAYGVDDPNSPSALSAQAVRRLLNDKVKKLPDTSIGEFQQSSGSSQGDTGAGNTGGTGY
jgi:hypothetical protein